MKPTEIVSQLIENYGDEDGYYVPAVSYPGDTGGHAPNRWAIAQNYTSRYLDEEGKWGKPMWAKTFTSREEAINWARQILGKEPTQAAR